jgi:hypothetical protein
MKKEGNIKEGRNARHARRKDHKTGISGRYV